jgi:hypothetical protein
MFAVLPPIQRHETFPAIVLKGVRLARVLVSKYYSALIPNALGDDFDVDVIKHRVYPHVREILVEEWCALPSSVPSTEGVPLEGQLDSNFEPLLGEPEDQSFGHDGGNCQGSSRKNKRPPFIMLPFLSECSKRLKALCPKTVQCGRNIARIKRSSWKGSIE